MNRTVMLQIRFSYGVERIYPMNEDAKRFAELCGRKTLSPPDVILITKLGFKVEWLPLTLKVGTEG